MENKSNPLTAIIFMIGILCAFVIAVPAVLMTRKQPLSLGYLAILLLMMAMALLFTTLRAILRRLETLEKPQQADK